MYWKELETLTNYMTAIMKDINNDFDLSLNRHYATWSWNNYIIELLYPVKTELFYWEIEECKKFIETFRDMIYNRDHIYIIKQLLRAYEITKK